MAMYSYTAIDKSNSFVKGQISSMSARRANRQLEKEGFQVINLKYERVRKYSKINNSLTRVTRLDKIFFTRHLYTLLEAGISLNQAIHITAEQAGNVKFKHILKKIHGDVEEGQPLNEALGKHPKYFSVFYVNLIKIGERSGKLDDVLLHLLEQQEKDHELVTKVRGAMTYPTIIILAAIGIVIAMMTFVVPKITEILSEYDVELPFSTRVLITISSVLRTYGLIIAFVILVAVPAAMRALLKTEWGRMRWDQLKLSIPLIKKIVQEFNLARISRAMASLLKSGVSMDIALQLSGTVTGNSLYRTHAEESIVFIRRGVPLSEVVKGRQKLYPPISVRMIEVGERTGKLEHMFDRLAQFYEKSVSNTTNNLSTIIEPFLLLMIGVIIGFIGIAILSPIWKFAETV